MSGLTDQDVREQFTATLTRMNVETRKFIAEHDKLAAEAKKLDRDRFLAPLTALLALLAAAVSAFSIYLSHR